MKRRDDISLDEVQASRPRLRPPGDAWVDTDSGRRVLEHVLASDWSANAPSSVRPLRSGWGTGPRLAFAAGAALIVVLAVVLTVVVLVKDTARGPEVASTTTSAPAAQRVSTNDAIAGILPMYANLMGYDFAPPANGRTLADQAAAMGLIPREAVSGDGASSPMTQGGYALLLARAFGGMLGPPALPFEPAATSGEQEAIDYLRAAGIIVSQDGDFTASQALTKSVEDKLVARLVGVLKYQTD